MRGVIESPDTYHEEDYGKLDSLKFSAVETLSKITSGAHYADLCRYLHLY